MSNSANAKRQRQKEARQAKLAEQMRRKQAKRRRMTMLALALLGLAVAALAARSPNKQPTAVKNTKSQFATFVTSMGDIKAKLLPDVAPKAVDNFVGLATGSKAWTDPKTGKPGTGSLYAGTIFHRVIPNFMIQGGDPLGTGLGGPGFTFGVEKNGPKFDKPGILAMANTGQPNSNGSQFFITVAPYTAGNGSYTAFGQVVSGQAVADAISKVPTASDKPLQDVVLKEVLITSK